MNIIELILPIFFIAVFAIIFTLQRKNLKKQDTVDTTELRKTWALSMKNYVFYGTILALVISGVAFATSSISLEVTVIFLVIIGLGSYVNLRVSKSIYSKLMENCIDLIQDGAEKKNI